MADAGPSPSVLVRGLAQRIGAINDELLRLAALARGEREPDLAAVRANWQVFVSPTAWSLRPVLALWRWDAPPLRHAIRAALAVTAGYGLAQALPWGSHEYWILLTIVVVLRGSLALTLERRNARVAGTLLGCVVALALLSAQPSPLELLLAMMVAQGVAHGFAARRYLVTAVAATVLGLVQAHMLNADASTAFALFERMADTLIGAAIAWVFCYVLPSWERRQLPALVTRVLKAQARHARLAFSLGRLDSMDGGASLEWRLARREAYDSLSALVQATQRSLSEPRAVRPPLAPLEHLQAHSYQLLAQLSAVKSMLVLRRDRIRLADVEDVLVRAARDIEESIQALIGRAPSAAPAAPEAASFPPPDVPELPDPSEPDITPWLLRRVDLAADTATQLRGDAARVLRSLAQTGR
jgi:uncharacterized membrane protein YccC